MRRGLSVLALVGTALLASRGGAQAGAPGERAVLLWVDREVAAQRQTHALRGLARALKQSRSAALLERYAELALPLQLPRDARHRAQLDKAAERLLGWLREASPDGAFQLTPTLAHHAGWALAVTGDLQGARELVSSYGSPHDERTVRVLRLIATWAVQSGAAREAVAALSAARGFAPSDPALAAELGLTLLAVGDAARALTVLAERFAADVSSLTARRDFAYALQASGRPSEAHELLLADRAACEARDGCLLELARSALEAQRAELCVTYVEKLLARNGQQLDALFLLADAHTKQGHRAEARRDYERILNIAPSNLRARAGRDALVEGGEKQ